MMSVVSEVDVVSNESKFEFPVNPTTSHLLEKSM